MSPDTANSRDGYRAGFAGIIGEPNIGKSTLLNSIIGQKVSIVSPKPQTTRNRILGIHTTSTTQIIFIDSPGIHKPREALHHLMVKTALHVVEEADCTLYLVPPRNPDKAENYILSILQRVQKPVILVINKIDLVKKETILPIIERYSELHDFVHIVPVSALYQNNIDKLVSLLISLMPESSPLYPDDTMTDSSETFQISELVREKVFLYTHREIPYAVGVFVDSIKVDQKRDMTTVFALILVEKKSHKGIIIGKNGEKLKRIGQESRLELEHILQKKLYLDLHVKCVPDWKKNPVWLSKMGLFGYS